MPGLILTAGFWMCQELMYQPLLKGNMMISYLRRKRVPLFDTYCCEPPK